ncbi:DsrE family protein [Thiohalophilus sp.]|uniref:DsrE family protein n=1 Tax=Thiohalophilus sp. TaxID=3028392 RepID=UPI003975E0F1
MKRITTILALLGLLLPAVVHADSDKPDDTRALQGIETGRILWDVTLGDPAALAGRLDVIQETYDDMLRQGVEPEMIFGFRGGAARLIARDTRHSELNQVTEIKAVHQRLKSLLELDGVHMEACNIATRRINLGADDLLPGIELVGNTFLSIMGYQQQGYATIRID